MPPGFLVRFRPQGPWRIGPDSGARDQVDRICHSDTLYAAVCGAMAQLGTLAEWLAATATREGAPAARFSSLFPFQGDTMFVVPPRLCWPPPLSAKVRWKGARFTPVAVVHRLLSERPLEEEKWAVDGPSECLIPIEARSGTAPGPFRAAVRSGAAVDRLTGGHIEVHSAACLEFQPGAGLWAAVSFPDEEAESEWGDRVKAALRLLADSGVGGERSRGWGRSEQPEFVAGTLPELILPPLEPPQPSGEGEPAVVTETAYWLLSLFHPAPEDRVNWQRGDYRFLSRGGRIESPVRSGDLKRQVRMVAEGSVLFADGAPRGCAPDVAPLGFPHPVFRGGFALSIPIPVRQASAPAARVTP